MVLALERRTGPATTVLTERECRQHDRAGTDGVRYSVAVLGDGRGDQRRWPDLVLSTSSGRVAIELELTPKGTRRLRAILAGYRTSTYSRVVFFARGDALRQRITDTARTARRAAPCWKCSASAAARSTSSHGSTPATVRARSHAC